MSRKATILCVLGADTGVGKTTVTCLLRDYARCLGVCAIALKPFSTGGREDAIALLGGRSNPEDLDFINPWHYEAPLAPFIAARLAGAEVPDLAEVVAWIETRCEQNEIVLVEGAGGLLTPIGRSFSFQDIAIALGAAFVVVVKNRLGAINQARLCYETACKHGVIRGTVVLSGVADADGSVSTNREAIEAFCPEWTVLEIPFLEEKDRGVIGGNGSGQNIFEKSLAQILQAGRTNGVLCETNRKRVEVRVKQRFKKEKTG